MIQHSLHDTDRNLLFGVLALQNALIDNDQFAEACAAWTTRKGTPLAQLLVERGWLTPADRAEIDRVLERKLKRHNGEPAASLAASAGSEIRRVLGMLNDPDIAQSLADLDSHGGHVLLSTFTGDVAAGERYTLTRLHATGGIGQVWLARDGDLGREVALKELRPERADSPALWARFLEEAKVTGQLEHPGIVPIYELARRPKSNQPFYTMRFVRGRTLTEAVRAFHEKRQRGDSGPLDQTKLLNDFVGVCNAVAYAHSRGVIHRDLKGQNVVLGDFGEVMVLDWGLAKIVGDKDDEKTDKLPVSVGDEANRADTMQGQVLGTPAYMAPEQAEGRVDLVDQRSDVYGLGAILYELLTNRPPFAGSNTQEVLRRVIEQEPGRPRGLDPSVSPALEAICLKALAKQRAERYASAGELAEEVRRFLADEPVRAYREPVTVRAGRWMRRHRTLATNAAVFLLSASVALTVGVILLQREQQQTELARQTAERNQRRFEKTAVLAQNVVEKRLQLDQMQTELHFSPRGLSTRFPEPGDDAELLDLAHSFYKQVSADEDADAAGQRRVAYYSSRMAAVLYRQGKLEESERKFAEAVAILATVGKEDGDDGELQRLRSQLNSNLGALHLRANRLTEAIACYQKAADDVRNSKDWPERERQNMLARVQYNLGGAWALNRKLGDAATALRTALAALENLVKETPADHDILEQAARTQYQLGLVLVAINPPEAATLWRQAAERFEQLLKVRPGQIDNRQRAALVHYCLGLLHGMGQRKAESMKEYRQAVALQEQLVDTFPRRHEYRQELGRSLLNLALIQFADGAKTEALATGRRAVASFEFLTKARPGDLLYQEDLAISCNAAAQMLHDQKKWTDVLELARLGIAAEKAVLQANPKHPTAAATAIQLHFGLSQAQLQLGDHAAVTATLDDLMRLPQLQANHVYDVACGWSLCVKLVDKDERLPMEKRKATAEDYSRRAMTRLREAVQRGFNDLKMLREDADFEAIRSREDFRKLVAELEKQ